MELKETCKKEMKKPLKIEKLNCKICACLATLRDQMSNQRERMSSSKWRKATSKRI